MNGTTIIQNKQLHSLVRRTVMEVIQEVFADPDYGLALNKNFEKRLKKSVQSKKAGKVISFEKVLKKYSNS